MPSRTTLVLLSVLLAGSVSCSSEPPASEGVEDVRAGLAVRIEKIFENDDLGEAAPVHTQTIAFGPEHVYVTFGAELYRVPLASPRTSREVLRDQRSVTYVDVQEGTLFMIERDRGWSNLGGGLDARGAEAGALHVSSDGGRTFKAIDTSLTSCVTFDGQQFCSPLTPGAMVKKVGPVLYYSAGNYPNLFATKDEGRTWSVVLGEVAEQVATTCIFDVVGKDLYVTSDVNDTGVFKKHLLAADETKLANRRARGSDVVADLGYRQGYFITRRPGTNTFFSGMEEGLVKSDAAGRSWKFVLDVPTFVQHIAFLPQAKILIAGNKKIGAPYLGLSIDDGVSWSDATPKLKMAIAALEPRASFEDVQIRGLRTAPDGKIYMVYLLKPEDPTKKKKGVFAEVKLGP